MKTRKLTAILGAVALTASCLAGCGGGKADSASGSKTAANSPEEVSTADHVDYLYRILLQEPGLQK